MFPTTTPTLQRRTGRRLLVALLTAATAAVGGLAAAGPAAADPVTCNVSGHNIPCATVIGIDPGSTLTVRSDPDTGAPEKFKLAGGRQVGVLCWTEGTPVNGYNIWTFVDTGFNSGYVSDNYLSTGHVQSHLPHC